MLLVEQAPLATAFIPLATHSIGVQLFRGPQPAGPPCAVAKYLGIAAVGTSNGTAFVLLPGAAAPPGSKQPQQPPRCVTFGLAAL